MPQQIVNYFRSNVKEDHCFLLNRLNVYAPFDFHDAKTSLTLACHIHVHIVYMGCAFDDANRKLRLPHRPTVPLSYCTDPTNDDAVCIPYSVFSGEWFAFSIPRDLTGNDLRGKYMKMSLQFRASQRQHRMGFSGSGSDGVGAFDIVDGVWDPTESIRIKFVQRYTGYDASEIRFFGRMFHAGICGVYSEQRGNTFGTFWLCRDEQCGDEAAEMEELDTRFGQSSGI